MQPGDLVEITRASIGIPKNTIALIVKASTHFDGDCAATDRSYTMFHVYLLNGRGRRYLPQDLRKINENR